MPHETPTVDVVVPVYGGWDHVEPCLRALVAQTVEANVIVVDDASPDDTPDRIARAFPELTLLRNARNRGFAHTCNRGLAHGDAPYALLVNSDVIAEPTLVAQVVDAFEAGGPQTGSVAPLLLRPDGRVDSLGITADATAAGFVRFHGAGVERADPATPDLLGPYGAAAAYRRRALGEVGLLDEGIFMYGEELDLAFRLRAGGWDAVGLGVPGGVHIGGASAGEGSPRQRHLAGFGRGYLLRAWGVLRTRRALRALAVEAIVCLRRIVLHRDVKSLTGRIAGWRAAAREVRPSFPLDATDASIGVLRSLRMRSGSYWERL
ncbi:glycosyltransferase [Microbacterium betulae]|uniref:Glycosyltransferase n=1 Tax=Microbacterium betulae TaxID=2981139 RepID=A0AA97I6C2_9MICO|nr:glycosyltransferase [Microbacterium sp. AB]WOF22320.1 glycosyltransferase [Microbacterium sp. AB]